MGLLISFLLVLFFVPSSASAQEMTSPQYRLELEQIEATTGARLQSLSVKQQKQFEEDGYLINTSKKSTLLFTISDTIVSFNGGNEKQQNSVLASVSSIKEGSDPHGEYGYRIISQLTEPLHNTAQEAIPLEYHISGPDSFFDFTNETVYKLLKSLEFIQFAGNDWVNSERSIKIGFQIEQNSSQESIYRSVMKLIALPSL